MNIISRITTVLLTVVTIAGCALPGTIVPNTTNADELVNKLGKPTATRANPGGGEFWDYVYGPAGTQTWRFGVDGGRMVRSAEQLLTYDRLYQVVPGVTTQDQVRELLGKPGQVRRLAMGPTWEWRVDLKPNLGHFIVNFDDRGLATSIGVLMDMTIDSGDKGDR
jgi:hypothetical protein